MYTKNTKKNINLDNFDEKALNTYISSINQDSVDQISMNLNYFEGIIAERFKIETTASKYIKPNYDIPRYAETYSYEIFQVEMRAGFISEKADDIKFVSGQSTVRQFNIGKIGAGFEYSDDDILRAAAAKVNVNTTKLEAAAESVRRFMNDVALFGDANRNIIGWFNNPDITPAEVAENAAGTSTKWVNKTVVEMVQDIINLQETIVFNYRTPNTLLLPRAQYFLLANTIYPNSALFAIERLRLTIPELEIHYCPELTGAFKDANGVAQDGMIMYDRHAAGFTQAIPLAPQILPVQTYNLMHKVLIVAKHGGTQIQDPFSQAFAYGI